MSDNKKIGIGPLTILTLIFITLKLTNHIDWSWFWVLSPTLIPLMILIVGWVVVGIITYYLGK